MNKSIQRLLSGLAALSFVCISTAASADVVRGPAGRLIVTDKHKPVVVNPGRKPVVIQPVRKPVVIQPIRKPVVIAPGHRHWYTPVVPHWRHWHGGKVVIVDNHHHHYSAFAFAMTAMAIAIVVDQNNKPYTENGKPVIVKERNCDKNDEMEVIELDDEVLILTCR